MKGALGFIGCAGICGAAYAIGKHVGREETLKEVEMEEKRMAVKKAAETAPVAVAQPAEKSAEPVEKDIEETTAIVPQTEATPAENVRRKHGVKNKLFGGIGVIKDILGGNADGKQLTMTVEGGDLVARISQKQGGG